MRSVPSQVECPVSVPQEVFEPNLLQQAVVDPEFQTTLDGFVLHRADVLRRRPGYCQTGSINSNKGDGTPSHVCRSRPGITGTRFHGPNVEAVSAFPLADNQGDYGFASRVDALNNPILDGQGKPTVFIEPINTLKDSLGKVPALATELPKLDELGLRAFIPFLQDKIGSGQRHD